MKTPREIEYRAAPYGHVATIPKGTALFPATNLPEGGWWAGAWEGMTDQDMSWAANYGFHLTREEV
jgi:hypothetical protein